MKRYVKITVTMKLSLIITFWTT